MMLKHHYSGQELDAIRAYWDAYFRREDLQKPMKIKANVDLTEYDDETNWGKIELAGTGDDEGTWLTLCGSIKPDADAHAHEYEITIKRIPKQ